MRRPLMGHFWKMSCEIKLKWDPILDGYTRHGFLDGKNHDGTGGKYLVRTRNLVRTSLRFNPNLQGKYLAKRGSGLTLSLIRKSTIRISQNGESTMGPSKFGRTNPRGVFAKGGNIESLEL
jgi:hypothetical protein